MYTFKTPDIIELTPRMFRRPINNEVIVARGVSSISDCMNQIGQSDFGPVKSFGNVRTGWHYDYAGFQLHLTLSGLCEVAFVTLVEGNGLPTHEYIPELIPELEAKKVTVLSSPGCALIFRGGNLSSTAIHRVTSLSRDRCSQVTSFM